MRCASKPISWNSSAYSPLPDAPSHAMRIAPARLPSRNDLLRPWQTRFAGDPTRRGTHALRSMGRTFRIVGVLPRDFEMPTLTRCRHRSAACPERSHGTLRPRAAGLRAHEAGESLSSGPSRSCSRNSSERSETVPPQFRQEVSLRVRPVRDRQVGDARAASLALFGGVLAVLLIACANIASLLMARAVARERERAVRVALGASRWRLARQTLTESLLLSATGAIGGCAFAAMLLRVFVVPAPAALPRLQEAAIDRPRAVLRHCRFVLVCRSALWPGACVAPLRFACRWRVPFTMFSRGGLRAALVISRDHFFHGVAHRRRLASAQFVESWRASRSASNPAAW